MAILVDMNNLKEENKKLNFNKFSIVIIFIISIFIVKLLFEVISSFFDMYKVLGSYYDLIVILIALVLTYVYSKRKYLKKEYMTKGFIDLSKKKNESIKVEPSVLKRLGSKSYIVNNAKVSLRGGINYIDTICINEDGVFIIYDRKDKGVITGDYSGSKWEVENDFEVKKINNPKDIIENQIKKLDKYIKDLGYKIEVKGIVYYSEYTELNIKGFNDNIKFFNTNKDEELINFVEKNRGKYKISFQEILDIISKIK